MRGLVKAGGGEHLGAVGLVQLGDLGLELGADGDHPRADELGALADLGRQGARAVEVVLVDVGDVEDRLGGHQAEAAEGRRVGRVDLGEPGGAAGIELGQRGIHQRHVGLRLLVAGGGPLAERRDAALEAGVPYFV